jgi:hypothetical protein
MLGDKDKEKGTPVPVQKYVYKICPKRWNPKEGRHDGCGKYFTEDSFISECPDCGKPLSLVRLDKPTYERSRRVIFEQCVKCADNEYALDCIGGDRHKPENCRLCRCVDCCAEKSEQINRVLKDKIPFMDLVKEAIRERREREREGTGDGAEPGPMAGTIGRVFNDEIPF